MNTTLGNFNLLNGPPVTMLPGDGLISVGDFSNADLRKVMDGQWGSQVALLGEAGLSESFEVAGSTTAVYALAANYLSPGARRLLGGGLGFIGLAAGYGWFFADQELVEVQVTSWEQQQESLWEAYEAEHGITRWDLFHYAIIEHELKKLGEFGEFSLADDWYRNPDIKNKQELLAKQTEYREMFEGAPTPPPYIDVNVLQMLKKGAKNKKWLLTISFLLFFFFWRKKKKTRAGYGSS
jgi:hypothetical protein